MDSHMPAPILTGDFARDVASSGAFWGESRSKLDRLPAKRLRSEAEQAQASALIAAARQARGTFLRVHAVTLYDLLTADRTRFRRVEELSFAAAAQVPGLVPTQAQVATEMACLQRDKDGHEIDQGLLFNAFLADAGTGLHLCHAMLLPRAEALAHLPTLQRDGRCDLGTALVERRGNVSIVWMKNGRTLNAEDETTLHQTEIAVDLALLDPATSVCVLRGAAIENGKYAGHGIFSTGINLTHLYNGRISYLWYLIRDLGFVNKLYRGLAVPEIAPDEVSGDSLEKPWIAGVDKFAIGGGCQYLLAVDHTVAASDAYMTLPARKEGIIPGAANLRLPRFVGDRIARQAIMSERRIDCDSAEGRLICDEIVAPGDVEAATMAAAGRLANSGVVSAASNRRAFRVAQEPLDTFRRYMAVYAREQALCHFSAALIANLEHYWGAQNRKM